MRAGQGTQKIPAAVDRRPVALRVFQLIARPKNRPLGAGVESFRIEQRPLIVVSQQADAGLLDHQVQAFARVRPIADDVAQAEDFFHALLAHVGEHRLECFQVAVNIADDRPFQFTARFGASKDGIAAAKLVTTLIPPYALVIR